MTYEYMHTIPNWDTHEANCDTDDPNRETYHPHNPRDTHISFHPSGVVGVTMTSSAYSSMMAWQTSMKKFTGYVVGHPEGVADVFGTVSCCQEPQCSS